MKIIITIVLILQFEASFSQELKAYGVRINVSDLDKAKDFYCTKIGFVIDSEKEDHVFLKTGEGTKLVLRKVLTLLPEDNKETCGVLSLQVNDLNQTMTRLKGLGVDFGDEQVRREGVGNAIFVWDPFGKRVSLMHQTVRKTDPFPEPRIYNYGFMIPDMDKALEFYSSHLGFVQLSQKYLPLDMPLGNPDKSFGFMLHFREHIEPMHHNTPDTEHVVIMFQTADIDKAIASMKAKGIKFLQKAPRETTMGRTVNFYDPFGYLSEIVEVK